MAKPPGLPLAAGVGLLLALLTFAAYGSVISNSFVNYDDDEYITGNPMVQRGLTLPGAAWAFTSGHASNWHPLTWLSHMVDVEIHGLRPAGHHVTSLLLHVANSLLLLLALHSMTRAFWRSAIVAGLFALHPLHVESVAWVAERKDVLSTFFAMLTLLAYARYVRRPGLGSHGPVVLLFALGLMAKPMLVTLPFVLLLLDVWPLERLRVLSEGKAQLPDCTSWPGWAIARRSAGPLILEKAPLLALAAVSCTVTFLVQQAGETVSSLDAVTLGSRASNALVSYVRYIGKTFWFADLAVFYPRPHSWPASWTLFAGAVLAGVSLIAIGLARRRPYLAVGWLWYLGTLSPVIGLIQVGRQAMADRYTYLPLIGLFISLVWGASEVLRAARMPVAVPASLGIVVALGLTYATSRQVGYWKDSITLFSHAIEATPANAEAQYDLGLALAEEGRNERAIGHYLEAVKIRPGEARTHNNLGNAYQRLGRLEDAIHEYRLALRLDADHSRARKNLALALLRRGRAQEAIEEYRQADRRERLDADSRFNLGVALQRTREMAAAEDQLRLALTLRPHWAEAHDALGVALAEQGKLDDAIAHFTEALRIKPDFPEASAHLEVALSKRTGASVE